MGGTIKQPTLQEKSKARLAVFPLFEKFTRDIKQSFAKAIEKMRVQKVDVKVEMPPVQKVEFAKEPKPPVINITEKKVIIPSPPKTQRIAGVVSLAEIHVIKKVLSRLEQKMFQLKPLGELKVSNLPTEKILDGKQNKRDAVPVVIKNMEFMVAMGGGATGSGPESRFSDTYWLREEYSYTTVSGVQVPTKVVRWSDKLKVTTDYEYDANANPIVKSRKTEPVSGAGQD